MNKPKTVLLRGALAAAIFGAACFPAASTGQAPGDEQEIAKLVAEIAAQQAKLAANQKALDERLANIVENVRLARIFVTRSGGNRTTK